MRIVALKDIQIGKRQRTTLTDIPEFAENIFVRGLLQLPGVIQVNAPDEPEKYVLVWGERRFRAVSLLAEQERPINHVGTPIPLGSIPVTEFVGDVLAQQEAEFDENIQRVEIPWQDRVQALASLHRARVLANPDQTISDTARELSARTGISEASFRKNRGGNYGVPLALMLEEHLNDADVRQANTTQAALQTVLRKQEQEAHAVLVRRRMSRATTESPIKYLCGDARQLIKDIPDGSVDLILSDPPYGVNSDDPNFSKRQANKHVYDDDPAKARELMEFLFIEGWRVTKARANLFMFLDSKHLNFAMELASRCAWTPFPRPIIWDKRSIGIGPWQTEGFQCVYEMFIFATKGQKGLLRPVADRLEAKRVPTSKRLHAAQKPLKLLQQLIDISTIPGDMVLDPFAGSGSTLRAASLTKRRAIGFELDSAIHTAGVGFVYAAPEAYTEEEDDA